MGWAAWLAIPAAATVLAAMWAWWRTRPARRPGTVEAMRLHSEYLDALAVPARGAARVSED